MANVDLHLKMHLSGFNFHTAAACLSSVCVMSASTVHECVSIMLLQLGLLAVRRCSSSSVCVCFQAAERDWEEKRASLTQFSAQDINRLLEETQAELMKAIPDLDFAARHINKPAVPPKPQITIPITSTTAASPAAGTTGTTATTTTTSTTTPSGDQQPGKVQLAAQKLNSLEGAGSHRGSGESVRVAPVFVERSQGGPCSDAVSSVHSGSQCGPVSNRETLQVPASSAASPELPVGTRPHHQPQRRRHRHHQEPEGEILSGLFLGNRDEEEVSVMSAVIGRRLTVWIISQTLLKRQDLLLFLIIPDNE